MTTRCTQIKDAGERRKTQGKKMTSLNLSDVQKLRDNVYDILHLDCPSGQVGCNGCVHEEYCSHTVIINRAFALLIKELERHE